MYKSYKYRIYPTNAQRLQIDTTINHCRLIHNLALETNTATYKANKTRLSAYDLSKQLTELKSCYTWLYESDSQAHKAALLHLEKSFNNFFNGLSEYPRFKKSTNRQSFSCPGNTRRVSFEKKLLTIPKIQNIPIAISRKFEGRITTITIIREPSGKYYASILVDNKESFPEKNSIESGSAIGIDVGIKDFAVLSDGTAISNPRHFKSGTKRLRCLQRRMSRKKKGSANRKKAVRRVAIQHERIKNLRIDFLHKLSSAITKQHNTICVESIQVKNLLKNRNLSKDIQDVGWGLFFRLLEYKCQWGGKNYLQVPQYFASTKTCNQCGEKNKSITLADRNWTCGTCGGEHHRDTNAAINIKQYFLKDTPKGIRGEPVELPTMVGAKKQEKSIN